MTQDELPGGCDAEVVVPVVVVPVVDVEAVLVEVADVHAVAVRVHNILRALVYFTERRNRIETRFFSLNFIWEQSGEMSDTSTSTKQGGSCFPTETNNFGG